jgi:hypothetical protein
MLYVNHEPQPLIVQLPLGVTPRQDAEHRYLYCEASNELEIDHEGQIVLADMLWRSRHGFVRKGNFDINHFAWLGPGYNGIRDPSYVIGHPLEVRRDGANNNGPRVFVKGEIFSSLTEPPEGSSGEWANKFWHSAAEMRPAQRWFPSVYGDIPPGGVKVIVRNGRKIHAIAQGDWLSIGFAMQVQHANLPAASTEPMGAFVKAPGSSIYQRTANVAFEPDSGPIVLTYSQFVKAIGTASGGYSSDAAARTGVAAFQPESLERSSAVSKLRDDLGSVQPLYQKYAGKVLKAVLAGSVKPKHQAIRAAFEDCGVSEAEADVCAKRLLLEVAYKKRAHTAANPNLNRMNGGN